MRIKNSDELISGKRMGSFLKSTNLSRRKASRRSALRRPVNGFLLGTLLAVGVGSARPAQAHGTAIEVTQAAVEIKATFDNGEPMADAQVLIYSPSDLETPWKKGQTDTEGLYLFAPDADTPGAWEVTVRKAGHGGTTTFAVDGTALSGSAGFAGAPPVQKWVSMAAIIWGFVGTALFFSRKAPATQTVSDSAEQIKSTEPVSVGSVSGGQH